MAVVGRHPSTFILHPSSVRLDTRRLDDRSPLLALAAYVLDELLRRAGGNRASGGNDQVRKYLRLEGLVELGIHAHDYLARHARREHVTARGRHLVPGEARFGDRRNVGRGWNTLEPGHADRAQAPPQHVRQYRRRVVDDYLDLPADRVGNGLLYRLVIDLGDLRAGHALQQLDGKLLACSS